MRYSWRPRDRTRRRLAWAILPLVALALVMGSTTAQEATEEAAEIPEVVIVAASFAFSKPGIEVEVGVPIRLVFINEDSMEHVLSFSKLPHVELDPENPADAVSFSEDDVEETFSLPASGAGRAEVLLILTEPGEYGFYCTVPGHEFMTGVLVVQPPADE